MGIQTNDMRPNEYQKLQERTEGQHLSREQKMANWAMGLSGEAGEVFKLVRWGGMEGNIELDVLKEAGDVYWYGSAMARVFGWGFDEVVNAIQYENQITFAQYSGHDAKDYADDMIEAAADLTDTIKKIVFHGHPETEQIKAVLFNRLAKVIFIVGRIAYEYGWQAGEVMSANIDKLRKRYPEGFDEQRSINRVD